MKWKIAVCVALAVVLQSSLRALWPPLAYADLPLIVVVYFALQRDAVLAVMIGTVAGLGVDVLSVGLLGAGGFALTLTAYLLAALVTRVMIDNALLRIPVVAGSAFFAVFFVVAMIGLSPSVIVGEGGTSQSVLHDGERGPVTIWDVRRLSGVKWGVES